MDVQKQVVKALVLGVAAGALYNGRKVGSRRGQRGALQ